MTTKEVIETIKIAIAEVEWNYPMDYSIAFEDAISVLKKQIPQKPLIIDAEYEMGYERIPAYLECPHCGDYLDTEEKFDFCPGCGQAIDWSDYNE